jgi:hypothetical protein
MRCDFIDLICLVELEYVFRSHFEASMKPTSAPRPWQQCLVSRLLPPCIRAMRVGTMGHAIRAPYAAIDPLLPLFAEEATANDGT